MPPAADDEDGRSDLGNSALQSLTGVSLMRLRLGRIFLGSRPEPTEDPKTVGGEVQQEEAKKK